MSAVTEKYLAGATLARRYVQALKRQVGHGIKDVEVDEANGLVVFTTSAGKRFGITVAEFLTIYAPQN